MFLPIESWLLKPAPFIAIAVLCILVACRNRDSYIRLWWVVFITSAILMEICWGLYFSTPTDFDISPRNSDPGGGLEPAGFLVALLIIAFQCLILFPAFPVFIVAALLPPKTIAWRWRPLILGVAILLVSLSCLSMRAKNTEYLTNFKAFQEKKKLLQEEHKNSPSKPTRHGPPMF